MAPSRPTFRRVFLCICVLLTLPATAGAADYVIQISVDGLGGSYLQSLISGGELPNFLRLQSEGAWTNHARTDYDYTITLPNHVTMVTGRGVVGVDGHNWTSNSDPGVGETLRTNKGSYVASAFDVAHDNGLSTAMYAGKTKFSLFDTSYDATNGAADVTGADNGNDKIDSYLYSASSATLTSTLVSDMTSTPWNYAFLHFADPDSAGHSSGWGSTTYNNSIKTIDGYLGTILDAIEGDGTLAGHTVVILSADHGGNGTGHGNSVSGSEYAIPFYVWGAGVAVNRELYDLNGATRQDPGAARPTYAASPQPIRNGDGANLALSLLGLSSVPGSTINASQDLAVSGSAAAPPQVIAYTAFNEATIGVQDWTPGAGDTEMGFDTTVLTGGLSPSPVVGTYDSSSSPRRLRMLGVEARTVFDTVDLTGFNSVLVSIDILIKNTTYEAGDYFLAELSNGVDTITLADVSGTDLNALNKGVLLTWQADVPDDWTQVTLTLSSLTNSSASAEGVDFDHIFITGRPVPEPGTLALLAIGAAVLVRRRRQARR